MAPRRSHSSMRSWTLIVAAVALIAPLVAGTNVPKIKKHQPVGFSVHSLRLYAPLSLGAIAAAAFGYDKKSVPMLALTPLLMAVAMLDWKASQYRGLITENEIDIDAYTHSKPSFMDRAKIVALHGLSTGNHKRSLVPFKLAMQRCVCFSTCSCVSTVMETLTVAGFLGAGHHSLLQEAL